MSINFISYQWNQKFTYNSNPVTNKVRGWTLLLIGHVKTSPVCIDSSRIWQKGTFWHHCIKWYVNKVCRDTIQCNGVKTFVRLNFMLMPYRFHYMILKILMQRYINDSVFHLQLSNCLKGFSKIVSCKCARIGLSLGANLSWRTIN